MKTHSPPSTLIVELSQEEASTIVAFLSTRLPLTKGGSEPIYNPAEALRDARGKVVVDLHKQLSALLTDY